MGGQGCEQESECDSERLNPIQQKLLALEAENKRLRGALEFYAEMDNWNGMDHVSPGPMFTDMCGVRARKALNPGDK